MTDQRRRDALHEAGHATAAFLLDRVNVMVSLDGPPVGGPCSIDRLPREPLGHRRRPLADWHRAEDEVLIVLAGPLCEDLADDEPLATVVPGPPRRVPDAPAPLGGAVGAPVAWQSGDEEPAWPAVPESDADQVIRLTRSVTGSEEERQALELALRLRAAAMVSSSPHFRALHSHLAAALLRDGELHGRQIRTELQRAELRYLTTAIPEDDDAAQAS